MKKLIFAVLLASVILAGCRGTSHRGQVNVVPPEALPVTTIESTTTTTTELSSTTQTTAIELTTTTTEVPHAPVVGSAEAGEDLCRFGGQILMYGLDLNDNGILDPSEIAFTSITCYKPNEDKEHHGREHHGREHHGREGHENNGHHND